jgi:hypothetical protein
MELCFASNLTSAEWASWVQALGAVGAILASALLVNHQHRLENRRRRGEQLEVSAAAAEALQGPIDDLLAVCQELHAMGVRMDVVRANETGGFDYVLSRLPRVNEHLQLFEPAELPSARLRAVLVEARHLINHVTTFSQVQYKGASKSYEYGDPTQQARMAAIIDQLNRHHQAIVEAVAGYRRALAD